MGCYWCSGNLGNDYCFELSNQNLAQCNRDGTVDILCNSDPYNIVSEPEISAAMTSKNCTVYYYNNNKPLITGLSIIIGGLVALLVTVIFAYYCTMMKRLDRRG
jgi:hypothetical protein